jgi:hypothetical protein
MNFDCKVLLLLLAQYIQTDRQVSLSLFLGGTERWVASLAFSFFFPCGGAEHFGCGK